MDINYYQLAIKRLCDDIGLSMGDEYTQEWVYELPEKYRSFDYFKKYIEAYMFNNYGDLEKQILVELMFDVTNDILKDNKSTGELAWNALKYILKSDTKLHIEMITYWALFDELIEDAFYLTPLVRELASELNLDNSK